MTSMYGANGPSMKVESAQPSTNGQDPHIKPDPESIGASPGPQLEDDIYEDTGDLEFAGAEQDFFLARLPKFLWDTWSKMDDNQEILVGTVRVEGGIGNLGDKNTRMSLYLTPDAANDHGLPREYNMNVTNPDTTNTFIFSEKDLPGYRKYTPGRAPPSWKDRKRVEKTKGPVSKFGGRVPKQTNLAGQVRTEINCLPVVNQELQQYLVREDKRMEQQKPKIARWEVTMDNKSKVVIPGNAASSAQFTNLISRTGPHKAKKKEKAARMARNELLDLIFDCFKQYKYWTLASLKERLLQPESYLRETLDDVAMLIKSGSMIGKYQLKPEMATERYADAGAFDNVNLKAEAAPDADPNALDLTDDFDEEMEDVPM